MKFIRSQLKNGLTILEIPTKTAESVVVDFFVKTGSRSETEKESGISHFLEHFLFKGTKKYPSALAISQLVDGIGGEMNANTGKEHTQFYIKAANQHLPLVFDILTDMIQAPLFDAGELEREKGVIVEEINMYKDTPMYEIENVLERTMWPQDPLGRDIAGEKDTVTRFTREMFLDYIERHYQAPNMILGVSGKYDRKKLWRLIERHWQRYPKKNFHNWNRVKDNQAAPRLRVNFKETEQAHLALGFKGLAYVDRRNPIQSVLSAILGGGMSSRLFIEVRERRGLAYYVRTSGSNYQDTGVFQIGSGVQVGKLQEAIKVIFSELDKIQSHLVGSEELKKAKEFIKGKSTLALEDNQVRLDWFLERAAFHPKIITPAEAFKKIDAVTAQEVKALAKVLFQRKKMSLAVIGPYKEDQKLKKLLHV